MIILVSTSRMGHHPHLGFLVSTCEPLPGELSFEGVKLGPGQFLGLTHWAVLQLGVHFCVEHLGSGSGHTRPRVLKGPVNLSEFCLNSMYQPMSDTKAYVFIFDAFL